MLFSIVTINYNNKEGLQKTIESVISQTCSDYEHIIIDGGSTDGSVEVIKNALQNASYAKRVSYWCSEKDSGVYDAMNKGIRRARGELIATLNSGDSYFPDTIENLVQVHKENPNAILYGAIKYVKNDEFISIGWSRACDLPDHMIP
ncbi:MAG: glycosyltransferase, partial [Treponema sp.]|nr:glycosyltransferase [Treponema sp.]